MTRRADDGDGKGYRRALRALRHLAPRDASQSWLDVVWTPGPGPRAHGEARSERAVAGGYLLLVIEAEDEFLEGEPPWMPKHSWSIYTGRNWEEVVVGGAASSHDEDKARVESLLRVLTGRKAN